ncbi:MAG: NAD(+) synthase [Bacteriovoracaceae bacterium]|nr:NAD(+) synthase [Bacteriovoracaceae bacterium]
MRPWNIILHQPLDQLADLPHLFTRLLQHIKEEVALSNSTGNTKLIIYPELYLSGYPLKDLILNGEFRNSYQKHFEILSTEIKNLKETPQLSFVVGGLRYVEGEVMPGNVAFLIQPGKLIEVLHQKMLLPNDDIFDEKKYFSPGKSVKIWHWHGKCIGVLICEDIWATSGIETKENPLSLLKQICRNKSLKGENLKDENSKLDLLICLSASPFDLSKNDLRKDRVKQLASTFGCDVAYANKVSADDELVFDGGSIFYQPSLDKFSCAQEFKEDQISVVLKETTVDPLLENKNLYYSKERFKLRDEKKINLRMLSERELERILQALILGIQEYAKRSHLKNWLVALSGGIDSAIVLTIAKIALPSSEYKLFALYMPGFFSQEMSFQLSKQLCLNLQTPLSHLPIKFLHSTTKNMIKDHLGFEVKKLTDENVQSRLRGTLLYVFANQLNAMVLNTSNKSEIAVGYSTLYGDSVGAISVIGDLYKTWVYQLANYINRRENGALIPEGIISREPSAELRSDQKDSDSLPPYSLLDFILSALFDDQLSKSDVAKLGAPVEEVERICKLLQQSEFKRQQFPPILKVFPKSFGFGHRVPIGKSNGYSA